MYNELDALNFTLSIDQEIERKMIYLDPHMSAFSLDNPREISDSLAMPKPVVGTIAAWLEAPLEILDMVKVEMMKRLFGV